MPRRPRGEASDDAQEGDAGTPARAPGPMPSKEAVRAFIAKSTGRVGKRELAREFGIPPELKHELRVLLGELSREGAIAPAGHRRFAPPGQTARRHHRPHHRNRPGRRSPSQGLIEWEE